MKRALITGITGQDGQYLTEYLLGLGYEVWGLIRGQNNPKRERLRDLIPSLNLIDGDLMDQTSLIAAFDRIQPDEVYNLAAISFVPHSWQQPELVTEVNAKGVLRVLEAVRTAGGGGDARRGGPARFYQASSSEMFGLAPTAPQNEATPFHPRSPYGVSKVFGHYITVNYRESYGIKASSGILFNHESPRRGLEFVTRKVTTTVARIKLGIERELKLGNLDARRDWGFAGDYVRAMHLMLQQDEPSDFVIGTGESHSVRELVDVAFSLVDLPWEDYVRTDPALERPAEVYHLLADASRARDILGWRPEVTFKQLIEMMIASDLEFERTKQLLAQQRHYY